MITPGSVDAQLSNFGGAVTARQWRQSVGMHWSIDRLEAEEIAANDAQLKQVQDWLPGTRGLALPNICQRAMMGPPPGDLAQVINGWHAFMGCSIKPSADTMVRRTDGAWILALYVLKDERGEPGQSGLYLSCGFDYATRPAFRGFHHGISLAIRPECGQHIFGIPAYEAVKRRLDATEVWRFGQPLLERLRHANDIQESLALFFDAIRRAYARPRFAIIDQVSRVCANINGLGGSLCIRQAAHDVGVSTRTLERWFEEHVGLPPKTYARVRRQWEASRRALQPGPIQWAHIALSLGYSDQAHFVREFTASHGFSPGRYRDFIARRGLSLGTYVFMPVDLSAGHGSRQP